MAVPDDSLLPQLQAGIPHLLSAAMQLLLALKQQQVECCSSPRYQTAICIVWTGTDRCRLPQLEATPDASS